MGRPSQFRENSVNTGGAFFIILGDGYLIHQRKDLTDNRL